MIGSSENRISYNGNGIATEFAYTFKILEKSDMKVLHVAADGTEQLLTKDYYVDMEKSVVLYPGYAPGAEIPEQNRPLILPAGERLVLYREVPITQESALDKHWPFNVIENGLDKLTIICQQIWDRLQRSFYVSESTSSNFDPKVPIEAGKTFRVKDDGTGFEVTEDPAVIYPLCVAEQQEATRQAGIATERAAAAKVSEDNAKASEGAADDSEAKALAYKNAAAQSASEAAISKDGAVNAYNAASVSAANAKASEERASAYEDLTQKAKETAVHNANLAINSANAAAESEANTKDYMLSANASASNAGNSAIDAAEQASYAQKMAQSAEESKLAAGESEANAKASEEESARILEEVKNSEANALNSKIAAANSAADAKNSADLAKNFTPEGYQTLVDIVNNTLALPFVVKNGKVHLVWRKEVDPLA